MIQPNELRIGNYVFNGDGEVYPITVVHPITKVYERFEPIPLTEDWLVKFGFEKDQHIPFKLRSIGVNKNYYKGEFKGFNLCVMGVDWVNVSGKIQKVHQLQNLYFAITGEELTLAPAG